MESCDETTGRENTGLRSAVTGPMSILMTGSLYTFVQCNVGIVRGHVFGDCCNRHVFCC